jgi:adenylylsulfate kinase-like enzyme
MGQMLVVMSGLPGTGKSAIADALGHELGAPVLSAAPSKAGPRLDSDLTRAGSDHHTVPPRPPQRAGESASGRS